MEDLIRIWGATRAHSKRFKLVGNYSIIELATLYKY
jgi:hypothetical protein